MEKKPAPHKPTGHIREAKWLITSASLAITLAAWNQFSQQLKQASAQAAASPTDPPQDTQSAQPVVTTLVLPPMPTLIPPAATNTLASVPPAPQVVAPVQVSNQPLAPQPSQGKLILGTVKPRARNPVTVTRSSHP
jgi:hypothetical protein